MEPTLKALQNGSVQNKYNALNYTEPTTNTYTPQSSLSPYQLKENHDNNNDGLDLDLEKDSSHPDVFLTGIFE